MCNFSKEQYEYALGRIEDLIDVVPDCEVTASPEAMELSIMSQIVMDYEDEHFSMAADMEEYQLRVNAEQSMPKLKRIAAVF